jgi:hypothetical protein
MMHKNEELDDLKLCIKKLNANLVLAESKKEHEVARLENNILTNSLNITNIEKLHDLTDHVALSNAGLTGQFTQLNARVSALESVIETIDDRFSYTKIMSFLIVILGGVGTGMGIILKYLFQDK